MVIRLVTEQFQAGIEDLFVLNCLVLLRCFYVILMLDVHNKTY